MARFSSDAFPSVFIKSYLSNTGIDSMNNFQLIKCYSETVKFTNFLSFQDFNFWGK